VLVVVDAAVRFDGPPSEAVEHYVSSIAEDA
jgi:hypothetical protein